MPRKQLRAASPAAESSRAASPAISDKSHHSDHSGDHSTSRSAPSDDEEHGDQSTDLDISQVFPFFLLAFASLGSGFLLVSWAHPRLASDPLHAYPVLAVGIGSMLLSPVIGYYLSLGFWDLATRMTRNALVTILFGAVIYQGLALRSLNEQVEALRFELDGLLALNGREAGVVKGLKRFAGW